MQTITILLLGLAGFVVFFGEARGDGKYGAWAIWALVGCVVALCTLAVIAEIALAPAAVACPVLRLGAP